MSKETIAIGKDSHQIEVKPLTLICKSANLIEDIKYERRVILDMEACFYHADRVEKLHSLTIYWMAETLPAVLLPTTVKDASGLWKVTDMRDRLQAGTGFRHCLGRIDLSMKLVDQGVQIVHRHPEDSLHPATILALTGFIISQAHGKVADVDKTKTDLTMLIDPIVNGTHGQEAKDAWCKDVNNAMALSGIEGVYKDMTPADVHFWMEYVASWKQSHPEFFSKE